MSNPGPTQKNEAYSRDFFSANIIQQMVDF
jgi:hypothetical protein